MAELYIRKLTPDASADFSDWPDGVNRLYSQEYISALLAELEAKDKRIIGLERHVKDIEATLIAATDEVADLTKERDEARAKLATPAAPEKCPCCNRRYTLESYAHGECAICGEAFDAAHALRSMGFKVEGDE